MLSDCSAAMRNRCSATYARASRGNPCTCPVPTSSTAWSPRAIGPLPVLRNLQALLDHGRLAGTGYVSILPVDQGIEHSAGASFAPNPIYFDPENIVKLAIEGGCNAVASTLGVLGAVARKYAHKIPFIVKFNHNEFLPTPTPTTRRSSRASSRRTTWARWRWARRSTSDPPSRARQIWEVSRGVRARARAGHGDDPVVLPAQQRVQGGRHGLPRRRPT